MKALVVGIVVVVLGVAVYSYISNRWYKFYYFPETNMYYDVKKRQYIYSVDGGNTWAIMSRSTDEVPEVLGEKIVLKSRDPNIWLHNPEHRETYNGVLTDINMILEQSNDYSARANKKHNSAPDNHQQNDSLANSSEEFTTEDSTLYPEIVEGGDAFLDSLDTSGEHRDMAKPINKRVKPAVRKDSAKKEQDSVELEQPVQPH
jgi:hypothetical protein